MSYRILLPVFQTILFVGMLFRWLDSHIEFSLLLFALGFVSAMAIAAWVSYIHEH